MDVLVFMYLRGRQMFKQHRIPVGGKPLVKLMPKASHERSGRRRLHGGKVLRKQWVELLVVLFVLLRFGVAACLSSVVMLLLPLFHCWSFLL